jgi:aminoglycoside phosphotransferase (APT) family kinase protein
MPAWDPEVVVDLPLAREVIGSQFADLARRPVRFLAAGWDNAVYVVDERWAFRFPRRAIALPGIRREIEVLPELAPMLPAPVPEPTHIGRPSDRYPWPFYGAPLLPGAELGTGSLDSDRRDALAADLGRFLRALHAPELATRFANRLPTDPMRRADMPHRVPIARDWLTQAAGLGLWDADQDARAAELLEAAVRLPPPAPEALRLAHGDLHLRHVLVDDRARLAGIIDWGDMCLADPAIDLSLAWSAFDGAARDEFACAYGPVDRAAETRARVLGLMLSGALAVYGRDQELPGLAQEAAAGLRRSMEP